MAFATGTRYAGGSDAAEPFLLAVNFACVLARLPPRTGLSTKHCQAQEHVRVTVGSIIEDALLFGAVLDDQAIVRHGDENGLLLRLIHVCSNWWRNQEVEK